MGLNDLIDDESSTDSSRFQRYGPHEYDEKLEAWVEEFQDEFPVDVQVDFIEVSPELESNQAKTYWKIKDSEVHQYIRVAESALEADDWILRHIVLECMVTLYCNEMGYTNLSKGTNVYKWLAGYIGANGSVVDQRTSEWQDLCEPLLEDGMKPESLED